MPDVASPMRPWIANAMQIVSWHDGPGQTSPGGLGTWDRVCPSLHGTGAERHRARPLGAGGKLHGGPGTDGAWPPLSPVQEGFRPA